MMDKNVYYRGLTLQCALPTVLTFMSLCCLSNAASFQLDGSTVSFAKFPEWQPCQNGSISLQFKTSQANALLLYTDGLGFDYVEVKLVGGGLRLRMNLGGGSLMLTAGSALNNDEWHSLEIRRRRDETYFTLDKIPQSKRHLPGSLEFGKVTHNREVFIGGLPASYKHRLTMLALPAALFETRFRGSIQELKYSNCGSHEQEQDMIDYDGLRTNQNDACKDANPCQNQGRCLPTDDAFYCQCIDARFTGTTCEQGIQSTICSCYVYLYVTGKGNNFGIQIREFRGSMCYICPDSARAPDLLALVYPQDNPSRLTLGSMPRSIRMYMWVLTGKFVWLTAMSRFV